MLPPFNNKEPVQLRAVSYHAVTRYVQRILRVVLPESDDPMLDAEQHARTVGLSIDAIRTIILTEAVQSAIRMNLSIIKTQDFAVRINGGVVTTVLTTKQHKRTIRAKLLTRSESKKRCQSFNRKKTKSQEFLKGRAQCQS